MIVVRYPRFGLIFLVVFGCILLPAPWLLEDPFPQDCRNEIAVVGFSILFVAFGLWKLSGPRIGFIVDRHGIWLPGWFNERNLELMPWSEMAAVRVVRWPNSDSEHDHSGLLVELRPGTVNPRPQNRLASHKAAIERETGPLDLVVCLTADRSRLALVAGPGVARQIDKCLQDPRRRERLSSYARSK